MKGIDSTKFEIIVRNGSEFAIHPDEDKFWSSQPDQFKESFEGLQKQFRSNGSLLLQPLISSGAFGGNPTPAATGENAMNNAGEEIILDKDEPEAPIQFETEAVLQLADPIEARTLSEEGDIELLGGKSGCTYLLAKKQGRTLPKHTLIAGVSNAFNWLLKPGFERLL